MYLYVCVISVYVCVCVCVYVNRVALRASPVRHEKRTEDLFACWCCLHDHSETWLLVYWLQLGRHPENQDDCQTAETEPACQYTDPNE